MFPSVMVHPNALKYPRKEESTSVDREEILGVMVVEVLVAMVLGPFTFTFPVSDKLFIQ